MDEITQMLEAPARAMGIPVSELVALVENGQVVPYEAGACLFHESTPRQWLGIVIAGKVEIRPMMYLAVSYDHRIIDGREAVSFLVRIKDAIEDPKRLLLDL